MTFGNGLRLFPGLLIRQRTVLYSDSLLARYLVFDMMVDPDVEFEALP